MISVGDKVRIPLRRRKDWNLPHLADEYSVVKVDGDYISFKTDERCYGKVGRVRRWHRSNLEPAKVCLENE